MADLRWNSVNTNFHDVNSAMGNSLRGLSQAGTIFGDLRKSVLDEEQRAIDNAYREKAFDENVRQFGLNYALDEDKLFETGRHNKESEHLLGRGQDLTHEAAMANVGVQQGRLDMDKDTHALDQQFRKDYAELNTYVSGTEEDIKKLIARGRAELEAAKASGSLTPEQIDTRERQLGQMERPREELSAIGLKTKLNQLLGERGWGGDKSIVTSFDDEAENESKRALKTAERQAEHPEKLKDSYNKGSALITKTVKDADNRRVFGQAYEFGVALTEGTNVTPEEVANLLVQNGLKENSIFDGQSPTSDLKAFVSKPENPENPIHKLLMRRVNKASSNTGSSDTKGKQGDKPGDKLDDNVNLTTLTPEALDYRKQQLLQDLPKVEDVTKDTPEVQARMEQLYRAEYGNMPKKEIPDSKRKSLEERALQDIKRELQQERTRAISAITKEKRNRRTPNILKYYGLEEKY